MQLLVDQPREGIALKLVGYLPEEPFLYCIEPKDEAKEMHAKFQELICSSWHPFKVSDINGEPKRVFIDDDKELGKLKALGDKGDAVIEAVKTVKTELQEYNSSGDYGVFKIWNFKEKRRATAEECCKAVTKMLRVRTIKSSRYDERLIYQVIHAHLQLDITSADKIALLLLSGTLGAHNADLVRPLFCAVVEGAGDMKEAVSKRLQYFKCLLLDDKVFSSALLKLIEETWLLGEVATGRQLFGALFEFTSEAMVSNDSIADWSNQIDEPRLAELVEKFLKLMSKY